MNLTRRATKLICLGWKNCAPQGQWLVFSKPGEEKVFLGPDGDLRQGGVHSVADFLAQKKFFERLDEP